MTLTEALCIKVWTPLREAIPEANEIAPGIFAIGNDLYLQTQPFNSSFETNLPNAPFVTLLYWCSDFAALQRLLSGNPSIQVKSEVVAPANLVFNTNGTYNQLLALVSKSHEKSAEMAQYNNKGAFLYKKIVRFPFTYYFTNLEILSGEKTCLIAAQLPQ